MTTLDEVNQFIFGTPGKPTTEEQYEAFFHLYGPAIKSKIASYDFVGDELDDIFGALMLKWVERDNISKFDSSLNIKPVTYVLGFVDKNVMSFVNNRTKRRQRYESLEDHKAQPKLSTPTYTFDTKSSIFEEVDAYLKLQPTIDSQNYPWLFKMLHFQLELTGKRNTKAIAGILGVNPRTVQLQVNRLRELLIDGGFVTIDARGSTTWLDNMV